MAKRIVTITVAILLFCGAARSAEFLTDRRDPFSDVSKKHWAYRAIRRLQQKGLLEGWQDGRFHGKKAFTRYEMAVVFARILERLEKKGGKLTETDRGALAGLGDEFRRELSMLGSRYKTLFRDFAITGHTLQKLVASTKVDRKRITKLERNNDAVVASLKGQAARVRTLEERVDTLEGRMGGTGGHPSPGQSSRPGAGEPTSEQLYGQ